ncbi:MAG: prepilin-type N-terminal cleavage/methylation domain-containing protein [Clostridiales Family XIII bacterium]|nr:prepilin-type N-terminal cleavage/methylation domain-containing protein [Clostridiales Family XIII bacterium]
MKTKQGMTLIEVMIAFAMIAVIAAVAVFGFYAIANVLAKSERIQYADQTLEENIASGKNGTKEASLSNGLAFSAGGIDYEIPGDIAAYAEDGKTFRVFVPDGV